MNYTQRRTLITVSATPDNNLSPRMPFSSGAEVLLPRTKVTGMADSMIEAGHVGGTLCSCMAKATLYYEVE